MAIKVRYNGLEIDGNLLPLFSGTFHYRPGSFSGLTRL
jgi:hypothetical protein